MFVKRMFVYARAPRRNVNGFATCILYGVSLVNDNVRLNNLKSTPRLVVSDVYAHAHAETVYRNARAFPAN